MAIVASWEGANPFSSDADVKLFCDFFLLFLSFLFLSALFQGQDLLLPPPWDGSAPNHFPLLSLAACPAGTFKASQGAGVCTPCPSNSRSTAEASPVCTCRNGYYRADFDPPAAACTSE